MANSIQNQLELQGEIVPRILVIILQNKIGEQNSCQIIYCARKQKRASIIDVGSYLKLGGAQSG